MFCVSSDSNACPSNTNFVPCPLRGPDDGYSSYGGWISKQDGNIWYKTCQLAYQTLTVSSNYWGNVKDNIMNIYFLVDKQ